MNDTFKKISIHLDLLERVKSLTESIIHNLRDRDYNSSINAIQNRERLLNIVFQFSDRIFNAGDKESGIREASEYKQWLASQKEWSTTQALNNEVIETFLIKERLNTRKEIAQIFDNKRRHKGYDLSSIK